MKPAVPRSELELLTRAEALAGHTLGEVAEALGVRISDDSVRTKGKWGELLERALGATGGSSARRDFAHLGVELKTIPVCAAGAPLESTYVCRLDVNEAERLEWESSWVRAKLGRVLFVPLLAEAKAWRDRQVGRPVVWSPSEEQEAVLRHDFDDLIGLLGAGRVEELTAHRGRWLQVRPKARDGTRSALVYDPDGEAISTVPRGFYLRTRLTGALLRDVSAVP